MTHDMRVLALRADQGGCAFYRIQEPARVVNEQYNIDVTVDNHLPLDATIEGTTTVVHSIDVDADVVIFQRPLFHAFVPAIRALQKKGIACIVEVDDDFHAIDRDNIAYHSTHPKSNPAANREHLAKAAAIADWVTVSTPALARRYGAHGRVSVIRNCVPKSIFEFEKKFPDEPRVGWSGTLQTHPHDLDVCGVHVAAALNRWGSQFNVVGDPTGVREALRISDRIDVESTGWVPREDYYEAMCQNIDIGIVPLELTPFNQAKSYLKGLEMAALGIPFIASPTEEYRHFAMKGIGAIAIKDQDWQKLLKQLLQSRDYLLERSEYCREAVSTFTYENHAEEWVVAWLHAIRNRRTNPV